MRTLTFGDVDGELRCSNLIERQRSLRVRSSAPGLSRLLPVADSLAGRTPIGLLAAIVPASARTIGLSSSGATTIARCRDRLDDFKCATSVDVVDALPTSAAGMAAKDVLRGCCGFG